MPKPVSEPATTHIIRASLRPRVYRDIEIASTASLHELADSIIDAYEFSLDHAFGFFSKLTGNIYQSPVRYELFADTDGDTGSRSVKRTKVGDVFVRIGDKMLFLFDYGDEWRFKVEFVGLGETVPKTVYPRVVASVGEAPEQYPDPDEEE